MTRFSRNLDKLAPWFFPLENPVWVRASSASLMQPDDPVLGLELNGNAWALPWWMMKNHHIANLVLNDRSVVVILCPMCSSAAAFDPTIRERRLRFRVGGAYNGTVMPLDYETGSLWTGFTGQCIEGPMQGCSMVRLPLFQCTWQQWTGLHPSALVPDGRDEARGGAGEWHAPGSPLVGPELRSLIGHVDRRLPHYELVLGVENHGEARCYPLSELAKSAHALNENLGNDEVVVLSRPDSMLACAYRRKVEGKVLDFRSERDSAIDNETGSVWSINGEAIGGPLKGRRLEYVDSGIEEFYVWAAFHPNTQIYRSRTEPTGGSESRALVPTIDSFPAALQKCIDRKWLVPGMNVLVLDCGEGMTAAWLGELGFHVLGIDSRPALIARARQSFGAMKGVEFSQAEIGSGSLIERRFDAVIDLGCLTRLEPSARQRYAQRLSRIRHGVAKLLILMPMPVQNVRQRTKRVAQLLQSGFKLVDAGSDGDGVQGARQPAPWFALRFVRAGTGENNAVAGAQIVKPAP